MQHTKNPAQKSAIITFHGRPANDGASAYAIPPMEMPSNRRNRPRRYHPRASKQRMKLSRYKLSGRIHKNGTEAMFCVMWFVTASNRAELHAASASHRRRKPAGTREGSAEGAAFVTPASVAAGIGAGLSARFDSLAL